MPVVFGDFDISDFWAPSDYARKEYVDAPPTSELVASIERRRGYRLPRAYVELARHHNGGIPSKTRHRTSKPTSWSHDHVAVHGIYSIGDGKRCSLGSGMGSQFWIDEWGGLPVCWARYDPSGLSRLWATG